MKFTKIIISILLLASIKNSCLALNNQKNCPPTQEEIINLITSLKQTLNVAQDPKKAALIFNQMKYATKMLHTVRAKNNAATIRHYLDMAGYYAFIHLIMLSAQNASIIPQILQPNINALSPHEDFDTSTTLSAKIDIVELEEILELLEEDIDERLEQLDHPDKTNIRKILIARKKALMLEYEKLCASNQFLHHKHNLHTLRYAPFGLFISLIGISLLSSLCCFDSNTGFGFPSQEKFDKNIEYLITRMLK